MGSGYAFDTVVSTNIGTITNTGGTASIGAIFGDMANSPFSKREPVYFSKTTTLNVNNTTGSLTIATLTGSARILSIVGTVTTVLSSAVTVAFIRGNDATNTPAITLATGTTLSSAPVGSVLSKTGLAAAALVLTSSAQMSIIESATAGIVPDSEFDLVSKNGATNLIEFRYTTTNAPSTGAIFWEILYYPINGGSLA